MQGQQSLYDKVTDSIIRELEAGVAPWVKPWSAGAEDVSLPYNAATSREYSGINIPILWATALEKGYGLPRWLTFRQAKALGGHVRKGEQGTTVVFVKRLAPRAGEQSEDDDTSGDRGSRPRSVLRSFTVFNIAQCDGLPERLAEHAERQRAIADEQAKRLKDMQTAALNASEAGKRKDRLDEAQRGLDALEDQIETAQTRRSEMWVPSSGTSPARATPASRR